MNRLTRPVVRSPAHSSTTVLSERWLLLARVAWLLVTLMMLTLFVVGIPLVYTRYQTLCVATPCPIWQLTPQKLQALNNVGLTERDYATYHTTLLLLWASVWTTVGAVIFWRKSDEPRALLLALFLVIPGFISGYPLDFAAEIYPVLQVPRQIAVLLSLIISLPLFLFLFPNGRFVPRWTRWFVLVWIMVDLLGYVFPRSFVDVNTWPVWVGLLVYGPPLLIGVWAQVYRYRHVSSPIERQQTKWVVFGIGTAIGGFITMLVLVVLTGTSNDFLVNEVFNAAFSIVMLLIPLSIGMAILRSRLYDIDVVINRTLVYGTLTVMLASMYVGSIVLLQALLRTLTDQSSDLAVVAATLAIAVLFQPLRRRIQNVIDRRFYRSKYDAQKTLQAFSLRMRDETDLDQLTAELVQAVQETLQPAQVSLWLREKRKT